MALSLGVDTGGTYTDAVLMRDERDVVASAKALTTRHDLALGVGAAVQAVLTQSGVDPADIGMAALSTTLATNALVEGQGGRAALIFIGFQERDLDAQGLREALKDDPVLVLAGGHTHSGNEAAPLDETALRDFLRSADADVSGFAIAARFAVRNPAHELRVTEIIAQTNGRPVSASHQLSAKLGGPKRALTAVLNARLIGMIDKLIGSAEQQLNTMGISAPLMVVRGDGALVSTALAKEKPIETILSGPAASIVGAKWMTGATDALVSDIGGTTTDVALLRGGKPAIDPEGARVGPHRTMVEAVAMRTSGLGGDSEVHFVAEGLQGGVTLGPRRLVPVSLFAVEAPQLVHEALDQQLRNTTPGEHDARFVRAIPGVQAEGLPTREADLLDLIGTAARLLSEVMRNRMDQAALKRLVDRGLVQMSGVTPSDAAHALGRTTHWDGDAADKALRLFGRRRTGSGVKLADSADTMAQIIIDQLTHQTGLTLLETAFDEDRAEFGQSASHLARHTLMQMGLRGHAGIVRLDTGLNVPLVGLGASAASYYPAVGELLGCEMILPEHAGVANAIGAVVGRITMRKSGSVTAQGEGQFRAHLQSGPEDFTDSDDAMQRLERDLIAHAEEDARQSGAVDLQTNAVRDVRTATVESRAVFVEATISIEVSGRPRVAST